MTTYNDIIEHARNTYRRPKPRGGIRYGHKTTPNVEALTPPLPTEQVCPERARAEAQGWASFGRRTWFLVTRDGRYRAVETREDAPGWSLVQEMKR